MKERKQKRIAAAVLVSGALVAGFIAVRGAAAQTSVASSSGASSSNGITFPIPELGNCSSQSECRNYCNDPAHIDACVSFGEAHGLMNRGEAGQAKTFANLIQSGETPGGCKTEDECRTYCSDIAHLDACLAFAKKLGVHDDHFAQGGKIAAYLKAGGKLPGGCASEESCKEYCSDFSHAEECYAFARNAGIAQANAGGLPPPGQTQKILELMKNGETPGGCKSRDECESYCGDPDHRDVCLAFGVKAGFLTQEQADMMQETGGRGPGSCNSEDSCQAYCNDPAHQGECLRFAEDRGVLDRGDTMNIQKGISRLQSGLDQAPPEVASCLKSELGPSVIDDIASGKLLPGPELADTVKGCFEKFGNLEREQNDEFISSTSTENTETENEDSNNEDNSDQTVPDQMMPSRMPQGSFQSFLNGAPPQIISCLKQALGDTFDKLQSGAVPPPSDISEKVRTCYSQTFTPPAPAPQ